MRIDFIRHNPTRRNHFKFAVIIDAANWNERNRIGKGINADPFYSREATTKEKEAYKTSFRCLFFTYESEKELIEDEILVGADDRILKRYLTQ